MCIGTQIVDSPLHRELVYHICVAQLVLPLVIEDNLVTSSLQGLLRLQKLNLAPTRALERNRIGIKEDFHASPKIEFITCAESRQVFWRRLHSRR